MDAVRPVHTLTGGTVSFGTFSSAHHFLLADLVARFRERYPQVRVLGRNSAEAVDAVRDGGLDPPTTETFAFVTRTGSRLSPATQELVRMAVDLLGRARRP